MPEKFVKVKEVKLKNNCPVCYNNENLRITFSERLKESRLYKWLTPEVKNEMYCSNCDSIIYPVQWTDDIERVYEYHMKAFQAPKSSFRLKPLGWIVIIFVALVLAASVFLLVYQKL